MRRIRFCQQPAIYGQKELKPAAGILRENLPKFQVTVTEILFYDYTLNTKVRVAFSIVH